MSRPEPAPRDRKVVLLMAALVAIVLVLNLVSAVIPGMDAAFATLPIIVFLLVGGTLLILARAIRG